MSPKMYMLHNRTCQIVTKTNFSHHLLVAEGHQTCACTYIFQHMYICMYIYKEILLLVLHLVISSFCSENTYLHTYSKLLQCQTVYNVHMQKSLWQIHDQNYLPRERKIQLRPIIKSTRKQISVGRQIPIYDNLRFGFKTIRDDDGLLLLNSLVDAATAMIAKMIDLHCKNLVNGLKGLNDPKFAIPLMKWNFTHFIPMHNFMH